MTEPVPDLVRGEALVRLLVSGVCGSDKAGVHGEHAFMKPPYYPGHEVVGVVTALAENVDWVAVGDRVTIEPTLPCGYCKPCRNGVQNLCENLQFFGCGYRQGRGAVRAANLRDQGGAGRVLVDQKRAG